MQKRPEDKDLLALLDELQEIVRRNCHYALQMAAMYYLEGCEWLGEKADQDAHEIIDSVMKKAGGSIRE